MLEFEEVVGRYLCCRFFVLVGGVWFLECGVFGCSFYDSIMCLGVYNIKTI